MSLAFRVITGGATAIYRQIVDQIRHRVAAGDLRSGDQLPSVRGMAEQLVVNPNTVAKAYSDLVRDGVVESRHGKGFFIADRRQVYSPAECDRRLDQALDALLSEALVLNFTADDIRQALDRKLAEIAAGQGGERGQRDE
jgi:GntR family transcriptional regulator